MSRTLRAVGLMSGTSMDGIDVALIETDGVERVRRLAATSVEYPAPFRDRLRLALAEARALVRREQRTPLLADVERELTDRHAEAVLRFIGDRMLQPSGVDVIGFHGQTVLHRPATRLTVQLGDGPRLAEATGIDVVHDLRAADVAAGGQGAPLVPVYHRALAAQIAERPVAFVNIGGVANVTWIGGDGSLLAFDTGPGNALIDDWMLRHTGVARDQDGACAASGEADAEVVARYLAAPYLARRPPKSLDRGDFALDPASELSVPSGAATLTAVTAACISKASEHFPEAAERWVICGGGRRNTTLMRMIADRVGVPVAPAEALGFDGDAMEAEAWAYLAVRSLANLPLTFPATTGVTSPTVGGVLTRAR